jgi:hypothetical protein
MEVKNQQEYNEWKYSNNGGIYGKRIFSYAEDWADLMAEYMAVGGLLEDIADAASKSADYDGITGYMYSYAAKIIATFWIHGEQFRHWFNLENQIGTEGEEANRENKILNTAILNFVKGDK